MPLLGRNGPTASGSPRSWHRTRSHFPTVTPEFWRTTPNPNNLFMVLGQTPMFFYLLHFPLLVQSAKLLGVQSKLGLGATYLGAATVIAVLIPSAAGTEGTKRRTGRAGRVSCDPTNVRSKRPPVALVVCGNHP